MVTKSKFIISIIMFIFSSYFLVAQTIKEKIGTFSTEVIAQILSHDQDFSKKIYAIVPMGIKGADDIKLLAIVRDEITKKMIAMNMTVISQEARIKSLEEIEFSVSESASQKNALRVGELLSVQTMLIVQVITSDNEIYIKVDALQVDTGVILFTYNLQFQGTKSSKEVLATFLPPAWKIGLFFYSTLNLNPVNMKIDANTDLNTSGSGFCYELMASYSILDWLSLSASLRGGPAKGINIINNSTQTFSWVLSDYVNMLTMGVQFNWKLSDLLYFNPSLKAYIEYLRTIESGQDKVGIILVPGFIFNTELELVITEYMSLSFQGEIDYTWSHTYDFPITSFDYSFLNFNFGGGIKFRF